MTILRESFVVRCQSPACRWTRLLVRSRDEAEAMATQHEAGGHQVEILRERLERVVRGTVCEVRR